MQARAEIDGGRFNTAEALLAEARQLDPASAELAATSKALTDARQRVEDERLRAEAEQRAAAEREAEALRVAEEREAAARLAEEQRVENERLAAEAAAALAAAEAAREAAAAQAVVPQAAGVSGSSGPADAESPEKQQAAAAADVPDESTDGQSTTEEAPVLAATAPEPAARPVSDPVPVREQQPVAASTLTRTKYVAPRYPRSAERRNVAGWVDVVFTVAVDGTVKDIEIIDSQPGDTFVKSATRAVERWEFEPVVENGRIVEKRAGVRMMFALQ